MSKSKPKSAAVELDFVYLNQSTALHHDQAQAAIPALQAQIDEDVLPAWGERVGISRVTLHYDTGPDGAIPIYLRDTSDVPGAGGYHTDDGSPAGFVFVGDAIAAGESWTVDASHETLEMIGDLMTNAIVELHKKYHGMDLRCLQELCDACEADRFAYTKPQWPEIKLSDFCLPAYFFEGMGKKYDFGGHLKHPAPSLLIGGYLGIELPDGTWTQVSDFKLNGRMSRRARNSHRIGTVAIRDPNLPPDVPPEDKLAVGELAAAATAAQQPISELPNGAPQFYPLLRGGVFDQRQKGPDGITDAQRAINPDPAEWADAGLQGAPEDDSKDTQI